MGPDPRSPRVLCRPGDCIVGMVAPGTGARPTLSVVVAVLLFTSGFGAFFHSPLLYYDARPAYVAEEGLSATDYRAVNTTDVNHSFKPFPLVEIQARTWVSLYASGGVAEGENESIDLANSSVAGVFSMSAMQLGPISANPLVYASDPRVLDASGILIAEVQKYLPRNVTEVTDLSVESEQSVTMLDRETTMTTLNGTLVLSNESTIDVRLYLARVVRDGELVVAFGIAPASKVDARESFVTLAENVRLVEWGEGPPETGTESERVTARQ